MIRKLAPALTNRRFDINRVVAVCGAKAPLSSMSVFEAYLIKARLDILRQADAIVRRFSTEVGFDETVWQFPVVLLPVGTTSARESVVLRPVGSIDGMTAEAMLMPAHLLQRLTSELLDIASAQCGFLRRHQQTTGHYRVGIAAV